jgi:hypothetical protein
MKRLQVVELAILLIILLSFIVADGREEVGLKSDFHGFLPFVIDSGAGLSGTVLADGNPVAGATVRIQNTGNLTTSDALGRFQLRWLLPGRPVTLSAWKDGYYSTKRDNVLPPTDGITLTLHLYQTNDNPNYSWIPPQGDPSCYSCKSRFVQNWLGNDAHSGAAGNARFLTMYNGTNLDGDQSPLTRYTCDPIYGCTPVRPDPTKPYYGPGYKLDFPNTAGNCAACHTPGAAVNAPYSTDPTHVSGANTFGIHCDFCHKIAAVRTDENTGLPYPNMPGVLSMDIRRPFTDDPERPQLFFGTFLDVNSPEGDSYLPLLGESRFCAPCHFSQFWGLTIYNSYGEWLESAYSDPEFSGARTCQECHMPAPWMVKGEPVTNVAPGNGGLERDPLTIHAHTFPGASSAELLQNAVTLTATLKQDGLYWVVKVRISNDFTGHSVPTDSPLRQLLLVVEAMDASGNPLTQISGSTLPEWAGQGDPAQGNYAGLPGKAYAKVLKELWTEVSPTGAYWNHTALVSDNRLAAFQADESIYTFAAPAQGSISVRASLYYRRAYRQIAEWKGWQDPDILMEQVSLSGP